MMKNFYLISNTDKSEKIAITNEFVLGRGIIKNCSDKRISRRHGIIKIQDEQFNIISTHINPIFYKKESEEEMHILEKDSEAILNVNDEIGLLPDTFWYKLMTADENLESVDIKEEIVPSKYITNDESSTTVLNSTITLHTETGLNSTTTTLNSEINVTPETESVCEPELNMEIEPPEIRAFRVRNIDEINADNTLIPPATIKRKIPDWLQNFSETNVTAKKTKVDKVKANCDKRKHSNEAGPSNVVRVIEQSETNEEDNLVTENNSDTEPESTNDIKNNIKVEPPNDSETPIIKVEVPIEDEDVEVKPIVTNQPSSSTNTAPDLKPSCKFGIRCYRKNLEHRTELAHPGDSDYRRPDYPPASPDAPQCPYGENCYRRNPIHFQQFQHPTSVLDRLRKRKPKPKPKSNNNTEESQTDYDFNSDSSDNYNPDNDNDDDDDEDDVEDDDDDDDDDSST